MKPRPKLPDQTQRLMIVGRTGSGKTQAAVWHLSKVDFESMPWLIVDYKTDRLINSIRGIDHIPVGAPIGENGIYAIHPLPHQDVEVNDYLMEIWARENVGIYIDEGYMVTKMRGLTALLTQGRSKNIPMIILAQRPVFLNRFAFSESDFFRVFQLTIDDDIKRVQDFVPNYDPAKLKKFESYYYDVNENKGWVLGPVPTSEEIRHSIETRLTALQPEKIKKFQPV